MRLGILHASVRFEFLGVVGPAWSPGLRLLDFGPKSGACACDCENAYTRQCLFNKHHIQQAFLQSRFYLLLRGIFHALRVPKCAQESLGTLPEAIYDMISY